MIERVEQGGIQPGNRPGQRIRRSGTLVGAWRSLRTRRHGGKQDAEEKGDPIHVNFLGSSAKVYSASPF
jgi:hypothetical protein